MRPGRRLAALSAVLALGISLLVLAAAPFPSAAREAGSRPDFPFLPRYCAKPADLVPQRPVKCVLTPAKPGAPTLVLWGDSHAFQMIPAIRSAMEGQRVNLVAFLFGACPVMDPRLRTDADRRAASGCDLTGDMALQFIEDTHRSGRAVRVVVGNAWQLYDHLRRNGDSPYLGHDVTGGDRVARVASTGTPRAFRRLARLGVPTDVLGQTPFVPAEPRPCAAGRQPYRCAVPRSVALKRYGAIRTQVRGWMAGLPAGSRFIETAGKFCTAKICQGRVGGLNTFADDGHVSASITATMGSYLEPTIRALLRSAP